MTRSLALALLCVALLAAAIPALAAGPGAAAGSVNFVTDAHQLEKVRNSDIAAHVKRMGEELRLLIEARMAGLPAPALTTDTPMVFEKNGFTAARLGVSQINMLFVGGPSESAQACIDLSSLADSQKALPVASTDKVER